MKPFWFAVCFTFDFSGTAINPAEIHWGMGLYNNQHFLHARLHALPDMGLAPRIGTTDPTRLTSPFRQFLECER